MVKKAGISPARVIAICNLKGGVGKTTTSINLSIGLARKGKKTLIVDFDSQANATQGLGYDPEELDVTIVDVLKNIMVKNDIKDHEILSVCDPLVHEEGVELVPCDIRMAAIENEVFTMYFGRERILKRYIDAVRPLYDYIIIDCLPAINIIAINALCAADEVLIPIQAQMYSVKAMEQLNNTIQSVISERFNEKLKINGILINGVNAQTTSFKEINQLVRSEYGRHVYIYNSVIPRSVKVEDSASYGISVYKYARNTKVANAYSAFTDEFLSHIRKGGKRYGN